MAGALAHLLHPSIVEVASGYANAGREWARWGEEPADATLWGVGLDCPLTHGLQFTLEAYGARHAGPFRAVGFRFELVEGLKLSAAIGYGHGRDRRIANAGLAWEY